MDGWQKDAKERRISVGRKQAGVLRESERGEQHFSVSSKTPAGKMLIISRCFLRVKMHAKNGRPLSRSIFIRCSPFDYLTLVRFLFAEMRFDPVSASSIFLSLCFVHFFVFFFLFLDRHRWIEFSFIFVGFLWGKGVSRGSLRPNFWIREVEKKGVVCALEIYEEEATQKFLQQDLVNKLRIRLKIELVYS